MPPVLVLGALDMLLQRLVTTPPPNPDRMNPKAVDRIFDSLRPCTLLPFKPSLTDPLLLCF